MKIIIIGAGISGCTAYLTLRKHLPPPPPSSPLQDHEYTIYEAYPSPSSNPPNPTNNITIGGGLGIAPNGLRVLERLDESILRDAVTNGYMLDHTNLKDKHGKTLIQLPSSSSSSSSSSSDSSGRSSESSGDRSKALHLLGTSRHNFWLCLRSRIPENIIVYNKRVAKVIAHPTQRNTVTFVDGSEPVYADLVIGADGLRSVVREGILDDEDGLGGPRYEGLIGIGGFLPTSTIPQTIITTIGGIEPGSLNLHFSGTGFFGYFYSTSSSTSPTRSSAYHVSEPGDTLVWWTTYSTPTSTPPPDGRHVDVDDVKSQLKSRFSTWTDPLVLHIINSVEVQTMWPTFTTPELPTWEKEGVVLVGDAAHALPSTSGQGANQALEDVEALARLVGHEVGVWYMEEQMGRGISGGSVGGVGVEGEKRAIQVACKRYVEMRMPRVKRILDTARGMQNSKRDMGGWGEWVMYWVMWVMGFFPGLVARQQQEVFDYDLPAEVERVLDRGL
ncbi:FAD/NAD(P)-binding domain-containing protein [Aspergillus eucalypticola CBS 122712]|uniref:FAD/NAD(P)-binding domain-containing protein n=1 Tax=Aspergillus eucalypticola (strain CBS 122712 / IBT 29274) TaxID=1448314 RepID=A0A317VBP6_ASPEC|nr:FAD/NAD(P)-binding domain-containing protein [Aspergillus eucalypticola CBS 122712]PWY69340.1 FAD/NAD(P)-binding domain-containing protein [Aspergillus eucalypticola CBS 122712]